ncbi:MAG: hypothetical protein IT432_01200 [Phycisphaerales bacterium]|nr:hypothetical protein [Phycisphaerales bacterium]
MKTNVMGGAGVVGVSAALVMSAGMAFGQNSTGGPTGTPGGGAPSTQTSGDQESIARLKKELEEARAEIAALKARIAEIEGAGNGAGDARAVKPVIPIDPLSCPPSMLVELKRRYEREIGVYPMATASQRERLMEEARRWCKGIGRELRGKRVWLATIEDVKASEGGEREAFVAKVTALDEMTRRPLGDAVRIGLPARFADRVRAVERERRVGDPNVDPATQGAWAWELTAVVSAAPVFDAERTEAGVFNAPAFVGPYVTFGMELEVLGLTDFDLPPEKKAEEKPAKTPSLDPGR